VVQKKHHPFYFAQVIVQTFFSWGRKRSYYLLLVPYLFRTQYSKFYQKQLVLQKIWKKAFCFTWHNIGIL